MDEEDWVARVERMVGQHGLTMAEYYLLGTAGYRVTVDRHKFIPHASWEFEGDPWPSFSDAEMHSALDRLVHRGLMVILTEADVQLEKQRRASSEIPELDDGIYYQAGHVDFTEAGYLHYRAVSLEIRGAGQFPRDDGGFNLDLDRGRFDVFAVTLTDCQILMDQIRADGDSFTGVEGTTFVSSEGPTAIGPWRPVRFFTCSDGYHGVIRFNAGVAQQGVAAEGLRPAAERQKRWTDGGRDDAVGLSAESDEVES
jgi:hypothetical protein